MVQVNLKDFFYWYRTNEYIEVTEEVAAELRGGRRDDVAHQRRMVRNRANYSLDAEDGIGCDLCMGEPTPQELIDRKERFIALWNALNSLPEIQGRRVDACIIMGKTYQEVADMEGISVASVSRSVQRGLGTMKKYLKKFW